MFLLDRASNPARAEDPVEFKWKAELITGAKLYWTCSICNKLEDYFIHTGNHGTYYYHSPDPEDFYSYCRGRVTLVRENL